MLFVPLLLLGAITTTSAFLNGSCSTNKDSKNHKSWYSYFKLYSLVLVVAAAGGGAVAVAVAVAVAAVAVAVAVAVVIVVVGVGVATTATFTATASATCHWHCHCDLPLALPLPLLLPTATTGGPSPTAIDSSRNIGRVKSRQSDCQTSDCICLDPPCH